MTKILLCLFGVLAVVGFFELLFYVNTLGPWPKVLVAVFIAGFGYALMKDVFGENSD